MLKQFNIDESYICDVRVRTETSLIKDPNNPTYDDIIKILKGHDKMINISNKDHDEFTKLRNLLEEQGYIKTDRGCWNGDRVLKGFKLNEFTLKKGNKFLCATAMQGAIGFARKYNRTTIGI